MRTLPRHQGEASMKDDKIIAALNELIETSKDGEEELPRAAGDAREPDLARAFSDAEEGQSHRFGRAAGSGAFARWHSRAGQEPEGSRSSKLERVSRLW